MSKGIFDHVGWDEVLDGSKAFSAPATSMDEVEHIAIDRLIAGPMLMVDVYDTLDDLSESQTNVVLFARAKMVNGDETEMMFKPHAAANIAREAVRSIFMAMESILDRHPNVKEVLADDLMDGREYTMDVMDSMARISSLVEIALVMERMGMLDNWIAEREDDS